LFLSELSRILAVRSTGLERRAGQAFVEFGFTLLVLSVLLLGAVDLARMFYYDIITSAAANAGVRAAAAGASTASIREMVEASAPPNMGPDLLVAVTPAEASRTAGPTPVWTTVNVTYSFRPLTPLTVNLAGGSPVIITRGASQRVRTGCCR
jgi:Flp pilus assembly protein TadG